MPKAGRENVDQEVLEFRGDDVGDEDVEEDDVVFVNEGLVVVDEEETVVEIVCVVVVSVFLNVSVVTLAGDDDAEVEEVVEDVEVLVTGSRISFTGPDGVVIVTTVVGGRLGVGLIDPQSLTSGKNQSWGLLSFRLSSSRLRTFSGM